MGSIHVQNRSFNHWDARGAVKILSLLIPENGLNSTRACFPVIIVTRCCSEEKGRPYLAALSKLKPAAGASNTVDSAIGPDRCVSARLRASLRVSAAPSVACSYFRFRSENGETQRGRTSQRSQHRDHHPGCHLQRRGGHRLRLQSFHGRGVCVIQDHQQGDQSSRPHLLLHGGLPGRRSSCHQGCKVPALLSQHPDGDPPSGHLGSLCAERAVLPKQGGAAGRLHHGWLGQQGRATGLCGVPGWDAAQAARHHRRFRQHLHLRIRRRQIQTQHEPRRVPAVCHQRAGLGHGQRQRQRGRG